MLAHTIDKVNPDPKGWLISEKLDGVRCYWTGKKMYSRNGNEFYPPKWFTDGLPSDMALDGELFTKRADFQNTISIVKKQHTDKETDKAWKAVTYMIFDAPLETGIFKTRLNKIQKCLMYCDSKIVKFVEHTPCKS